MRSLIPALGAVTLLASAPPPARGDTPAPGYFVESELAIPQYASFATLRSGGILVFDGDDARVLVPPLWIEGYLGSTSSFGYPSFVLVHPAQAYALLGESTAGGILEADFASESLPQLAQIPFNFDAAWEDAGHFLVSAAPCVLFCGNRILRVDAADGSQTLLAQVNGPSGPLALAANGDLYYGLQSATFPPPPGSNRVIRWSAAQVRSGSPLTEADATPVVLGLDAVAALEIDTLRGHLWVAESRFPGGSEVLEYRLDGALVGSIVASPDWISNLEVKEMPGNGSARLYPPARRLRIRYAAIDYGSSGPARLVTVRARSSALPRASF